MVVGKKMGGIVLMYIFAALFSLFGMYFTAITTTENAASKVVGFVFFAIIEVISVIIVIGILRTPKDAIIINADKSISIPSKNVVIPMNEVQEISYRRASARGVQYKWGKVYIVTNSNKYTVNYISKCEYVAKELTREMYEYRHMAGLL